MIRVAFGRMTAFCWVAMTITQARAQSPVESTVPVPVASPSKLQAGAAVVGDRVLSQKLIDSHKDLEIKLRQGRRERVAPVPPALEIEVLDPRVDPMGNPAVLTSPTENGGLHVEIPPVVLVHRYYYTGDRSFQGPMLPGGPSIIVVHHPKTGAKVYLETQMLPGAPRVIYTANSIEYDYGFQSMTLKFGHGGKPSIVYRQGTSLWTRVKQNSEQRHEYRGKILQRTGIPDVRDKILSGAKNVAETSADRVRDLGRTVATPVLQIVKATPLGTAFTTSPEQRATRERDDLVRRAEAEATRLQADIPTNR